MILFILFFFCDCRVTYLLRLQSLMLRYGDLVEKQQDGNRMCTRRGRTFSQSSEERCYLQQNWTIHFVCRFLSVQQCPWYFPFFPFQVDLKTFGNWEDSPEKMMMDMISDPNRVRREDRWILFCVKKSSANVQWLPVHENGEYWSSSPRGDVEKSVHIFDCPFVWATRDTSLKLCIRKRLAQNIISINKMKFPLFP